MGNLEKQVVVLQPFGKETDALFALIVEATGKAGVRLVRADTVSEKAVTVGSFFSVIQQSWLVIADVSNGNPNVMYELGFAQGLRKPIVLVATGIRSVPFDLASRRVVIYDPQAAGDFVARLGQAIQEVGAHPESFVLS